MSHHQGFQALQALQEDGVQWYHCANGELENVGFNLSLTIDGQNIVLGFDPRSNEAGPEDKRMGDLKDKTRLQTGAHAGYLFIMPDGKRVKVSGGFWGAGHCQYD